MTKVVPTHEDGETRAEFIAKIAKVYDVPMNLIRYEEISNTLYTHVATEGE